MTLSADERGSTAEAAAASDPIAHGNGNTKRPCPVSRITNSRISRSVTTSGPPSSYVLPRASPRASAAADQRHSQIHPREGSEAVEELVLRSEHNAWAQDGGVWKLPLYALLADGLGAGVHGWRRLVRPDRRHVHELLGPRGGRCPRGPLRHKGVQRLEPLLAALGEDADQG